MANEPETRLADLQEFRAGWDRRVRAAIVLISVGFVSLAAMTVGVLPVVQWIPPALVVAFSIVVLVLSRRYSSGRRVRASTVYNATIVAEILQVICLPCLCYGVFKTADATVDWLAPASLTAWWLAGYGTMQMAKRVGAGSLILVAFPPRT